jgi:putative methyltransferase
VTKVLQNKHNIDHLIQETNILSSKPSTNNTKSPIKNMGLFYIMIYELLFAQSSSSSSQQSGGTIKGGGAVKRYILQHESILREKYQEYYRSSSSTTRTETDRFDNDNDEKGHTNYHHHKHQQHRYVRVNTCVTTTMEFLQLYKTTMMNDETNQEPMIYRDEHIPDLFVIPSHLTSKLLSTLTHSTKSHHIVLQDKSSCIPAYCLYSLLQQQQQQQLQGKNDTIQILDACAAPGNKTSHVAALVLQWLQQKQYPSNVVSATIYALDRDKERCQILQDRMKTLVPNHSTAANALTGNIVEVRVQHKDFLSITGLDKTKNEYTDLTCIVLDPSCSGSGLYHRNSLANDIATTTTTTTTALSENSNYLISNDDPQQQQRIEKLSNFQITCLRHALTSFPNVHTVIYSTCSTHVLENEHVVASVFGTHNPSTDTHVTLRDEWSIVAPPDLQNWKRRGIDLRKKDDNALDGTTNDQHDMDDLYGDLTKEEINCFIRTNYEDRTNGFFVACFQRKSMLLKSFGKKGHTRKVKMIQPQLPSELDIPIYNGEFDQMILHRSEVDYHNYEGKRKNSPHSVTTNHNDKSNHGSNSHPNETNITANTDTTLLPTTNNKKRKLEKKVSDTKTSMKKATVGAVIPNTSGDNAATTGHTKTTTKYNKKRAKKLEWKKRQHEAKLLRTTNQTKQNHPTTNADS